MSRKAALGELARRYLAGPAPADDRDLAKWAGIGLRDARLGLAECGAEQRTDGMAQLPDGARRAAAPPARRVRPTARPWPERGGSPRYLA